MAKLVSPKTWVLDLLSVPYQFCVLRYLIYKSHDGDGGDDDGGSRDNRMLMVTLVVVLIVATFIKPLLCARYLHT